MPARLPTLLLTAVCTVVLSITAAVRTHTQSQLSALPASADSPSDNPTTDEKVALGRLLFWDPVLSGTKDVACATCHHPNFGYTDGRDLPIGVTGVGLGRERRFAEEGAVPFVKRNSPSVVNAAFNGMDKLGHYHPSS